MLSASLTYIDLITEIVQKIEFNLYGISILVLHDLLLITKINV